MGVPPPGGGSYPAFEQLGPGVFESGLMQRFFVPRSRHDKKYHFLDNDDRDSMTTGKEITISTSFMEYSLETSSFVSIKL